MYRAWDKKEKEMFHNVNPLFNQYGELDAIILNYQLNGIGIEIMEYDDAFEYIKNDEDFPYVVMRPTGLPDKNGKWIVEGDIVKQTYEKTIFTEYDAVSLGYVDSEHISGYHIGEVVITATKGACIKNAIHYSEDEGKTYRTKNYKEIVGYRSEVIGNMYEDSHLLEGATNGSS